jgi:hypothetical protein
MILIITWELVPDADHDLILNLYLGVTPGSQIMFFKHALQSSFVDPFLSLIKFILVLLATPLFYS